MNNCNDNSVNIPNVWKIKFHTKCECVTRSMLLIYSTVFTLIGSWWSVLGHFHLLCVRLVWTHTHIWYISVENALRWHFIPIWLVKVTNKCIYPNPLSMENTGICSLGCHTVILIGLKLGVKSHEHCLSHRRFLESLRHYFLQRSQGRMDADMKPVLKVVARKILLKQNSCKI